MTEQRIKREGRGEGMGDEDGGTVDGGMEEGVNYRDMLNRKEAF